MTRRTADVRFDIQFFSPFFAVCRLLFLRHLNVEIKLRDLLWVANVGFRVSMAVKAEFHRERCCLRDDFHFVNSTVAGNATDTLPAPH